MIPAPAECSCEHTDRPEEAHSGRAPSAFDAQHDRWGWRRCARFLSMVPTPPYRCLLRSRLDRCPSVQVCGLRLVQDQLQQLAWCGCCEAIRRFGGDEARHELVRVGKCLLHLHVAGGSRQACCIDLQHGASSRPMLRRCMVATWCSSLHISQRGTICDNKDSSA